MPKPANPAGFTPDEFAALSGSTPAAVRARIRRGTLPAMQFGRSYLMPVDFVQRHLAEVTQ